MPALCSLAAGALPPPTAVAPRPLPSCATALKIPRAFLLESCCFVHPLNPPWFPWVDWG